MKKGVLGGSIWVVILAVVLTGSVVGASSRGLRRTSRAPASHPLPEMFEQGSSGNRQLDKYVPGEILFKVKRNSAAARKFGASSQSVQQDAGSSDATSSSFEQLLTRHHISKVGPAFGRLKSGVSSKANARSGKGAESTKPFRGAAKRSDLSRWYRLELPADANEQELLELLK
jgi:hypothetical protein